MVVHIVETTTPSKSCLPNPLEDIVPQIANARPSSDWITLHWSLNPLPSII